MIWIIEKSFRRLENIINRRVLHHLESINLWRDGGVLPFPPVFIIGPPRSGSTLLMQVLTDAFDVSYLSNAHSRWFGAPTYVEKWLRPLRNKRPSDYRSCHGQTSQYTDPSECGQWWYRFFRHDPAYVTCRDVDMRGMYLFRNSIMRLTQLSGSPWFFKNLYASLRLEPIVETVPEAFFIIIKRNCLDNAHSILKARFDANSSYEPWWSVPPPNVSDLVNSFPVEQALGQINSIHSLIERDLNRLGAARRIFRVQYEDFCGDVHGTLQRFEHFMASHGVFLKRRFDVPGSFRLGHSVNIPSEMYDTLQHFCSTEKGSYC